MALANAYAAAIAEASEKGGAEFVKKLVVFMKSRGHLSLLPQIVRILERETDDADMPVVTLAKESDAKKFAHAIKEAVGGLPAPAGEKHVIRIDPRAVGGYSVRTRGMLVDKTFRTALISLYRNATHS